MQKRKISCTILASAVHLANKFYFLYQEIACKNGNSPDEKGKNNVGGVSKVTNNSLGF
jgi:hypothetical protein